MGAQWFAVDVETATKQEHSVCSLGVAAVAEDGERIEREWLVKPPGNRYNPENTAIHGLTAEHTRDAPAFPDAWAEARELLVLSRTIAHNAAFDVGCIRAAMRYHKQKEPGFRPLGCTLRMSHLVWPQRTKPYQLQTLGSEHGIPIEAHRAASDAAATLALADVLVAHWDNGDLEALRAASNKGHEGRAKAAMRRVAGANTGAPTARQVEFLTSLLERREIVPSSVLPHIKTGGQMSRIIDVILDGPHPNDFDTYEELRRHVVWLERKVNDIVEEPLPGSRPARPPARSRVAPREGRLTGAIRGKPAPRESLGRRLLAWLFPGRC